MNNRSLFSLVAERGMAKTVKYIIDTTNTMPSMQEILNMLHECVKTKKFPLVYYFLDEKGVSLKDVEKELPNALHPIRAAAFQGMRRFSWTPTRVSIRSLFFSRETGNTEMVKYLIGKGADPWYIAPGIGCTLHCIARGHGSEEALIELMNYLLSLPGSDINVRNADGNTPLHLAMEGYHKKVITAIFKAGGDPNAQNNAGKKPIEMISQFNDNIPAMQRFATKLFAGRIKRKADGDTGDESDAKKAKKAVVRRCCPFFRLHAF
jgi:hypothetical protein